MVARAALGCLVVIGLGLGGIIAHASTAAAQETPADAGAQPSQPSDAPAGPEAEARSLFRRGVALSREERWGEALEYFRRSGALVARPSTTFNIALALLRLGHPTEARQKLVQYLEESEGLERETGRRTQAAELMTLAEAATAQLTLRVHPEGAELRIDGVLIEGAGAARVLPLDPGSHAVRVTAEGFVAQALELSLLEGESVDREVTLSPRTDPARVRVTASVATADISIDGAEVARGTFVGELEPGRHRITVRAEGYEPFRREIDVAAMQRLEVEAALSRIDDSTWLGNPWLWVAVGVVVVGAGVGIGVGVASSGTADPYGGTSGVVLQGLTAAP